MTRESGARATEEDQGHHMAGVFSALLNWGLRFSFDTTSGGRIYTVRDGTRVIVQGVTASKLKAWVADRKARDLYHQLPEGHAVALVGAPMAGKTDTALRIAREALGSGPVIYAALEDGEAVLRARMHDDLGADPEDWGGMTIVSEMPRVSINVAMYLGRYLAEMRGALVVVDSLVYVRPKADDDDDGASLEALANFEVIAINYSARILIIHHIKNLAEFAKFPSVVKTILHQDESNEKRRVQSFQ